MAEAGHATAEHKRPAPARAFSPAPDGGERGAPALEAGDQQLAGLGGVALADGGAGGGLDKLESRHAALLADPRLGGSAVGAQRVRLLQRLQHGYGNGYVARVIARVHEAPPGSSAGVLQRECAAPPMDKPKLEPVQDPKFLKVKGNVRQVAAQEKQHAPAKAKVAEAQNAAVPPANDTASKAAANQVDQMGQQKPGEFDKKAFVAAVKKAIEAATPKNMEEAEQQKGSGKTAQVKEQVGGMVKQGKEGSEKGIKETTQAPPDASKVTPKPVTAMPEEKPGAPPGDVGAANALPSPKSPEEVNLAHGPCELNSQMAEAKVTDEQLKKSNEPQFQDTLDAKKKTEEQAKTAPAEYRKEEQKTLQEGKAEQAKGAAGMLAGMHHAKTAAAGKVGAHKDQAKAKEEAERAKVAADIEGIYNETKADVTKILNELEPKVNAAFDKGEQAAREFFENYVATKTQKFKDERYSGPDGWGRWIVDKVGTPPPEFNRFIDEGRAKYIEKMDAVINDVADTIGRELTAAKNRIAEGRKKIQDYVSKLPKNLKQAGLEAQQKMGSQFEQLESDVNDKQEGLVQTLADKYTTARDALDEHANAMKEENKGLLDMAKDAVKGTVDTILKLKDMLLGVLRKAGDVIDKIIQDPIGFLGNLVNAIKQGLNQFVSNIGTHLKKGLMGWLFGTLGDAGITLPESLDLKGILSLVLQILGLTWDNIRAIAVKIAGEPVVAAIEKTAKFFILLAQQGPAGLWEFIKEKIAEINLKEMVIEGIKSFVITKVITAGITWLIGLLNPAAAFVKACKMIIDVVGFFIERGAQIMEFVNSVLDGIGAIAAGQIGAAANLVESSLAKILPLAISFLASLIGIGGIAEKIKELIEKVRAPITKLVHAVLGPILKPIKKLYDKGAKFVKGLIDKGKALGKKALNKVKEKAKGLFGGSKKPQAAGTTDQSAAVKKKAHEELHQRTRQPFPNREALNAVLAEVLNKLRPEGLKNLAATPKKDAPTKLTILATASPEEPVDTAEIASDEIPAKRFLPAKFREKGAIRKKLYERGSGWSTVQKQVNKWAVNEFMPLIDLIKEGIVLTREEAHAEIQKAIDAGLLPRIAHQKYEAKQFNARWIENDVQYHVDHKHSLAEHWVNGGNNSDDAARQEKTTDPENLRWITQEANLSKGSKNVDDEGSSHYLDKPWVGPSFSSALAEEGKAKAKKIDGQPFLDEQGNPIP